MRVYVPGKHILHLSPDGEVKKTLKHPKRINGYVVSVNTGTYVAVETLNYPELFHVYNARGFKQRAFGFLSNLHILEEPEEMQPVGHRLDFMGSLVTDGNSSFMYAGTYKGGLLGF